MSEFCGWREPAARIERAGTPLSVFGTGGSRARTIWRVGIASLVVVAAALSGCGNALYAVHANDASSRLEEAKELGAERFAPYEYHLAKAHLEKAREEAAEADYGDANTLAQQSEEY